MKEQSVNTQPQGEYPELPEPESQQFEWQKDGQTWVASSFHHVPLTAKSVKTLDLFTAAQVYAAIDADRALRNQASGEPVGVVYTVEALVPGGKPKPHAMFLKSAPSGTKLYTHPAPSPEVVEALEKVLRHLEADAIHAAIIELRAALRSLGGEQK